MTGACSPDCAGTSAAVDPWRLYLELPNAAVDYDLAGLADRLGLGGTAGPDGAWILHFGSTAIQMQYGADAERLLRAVLDGADAIASVGNASVLPPEHGHIIALSIQPAAIHGVKAGDGKWVMDRLQQIQQLCCAAAILSEATGATRLYCATARLWSPAAALIDAIAALERQGIPPLLHIVAFLGGTSNGDAVLSSRGLCVIAGFELVMRYPPALPVVEAIRRLARLAVHALVAGPLQSGAVVAGIAPGETLTIGTAGENERAMGIMPVVLRFV